MLLRHEITHVATRDLTSDSAPLWLVEGFADWVAFHGMGLSLRQAAPLLTSDVSALPADFSGPGRDLAYQQAYSIMVLPGVAAGGAGCRGLLPAATRPLSAVDPEAASTWRAGVSSCERASASVEFVRRTLLVTNDFPPRPGGIQSYLHALATRLPADSLVVYAPKWKGAEEFDAEQPFPVVRHPTSLMLPTPDVLRPRPRHRPRRVV